MANTLGGPYWLVSVHLRSCYTKSRWLVIFLLTVLYVFDMCCRHDVVITIVATVVAAAFVYKYHFFVDLEAVFCHSWAYLRTNISYHITVIVQKSNEFTVPADLASSCSSDSNYCVTAVDIQLQWVTELKCITVIQVYCWPYLWMLVETEVMWPPEHRAIARFSLILLSHIILYLQRHKHTDYMW